MPLTLTLGVQITDMKIKKGAGITINNDSLVLRFDKKGGVVFHRKTFKSVEISEGAKKVLTNARGNISLSEIKAITGLSNTEMIRILTELRLHGIIRGSYSQSSASTIRLWNAISRRLKSMKTT